MSDHSAQIPLPITAVQAAWRRYVGYGELDSAADDGSWRADDESGLVATFALDGPARTTVVVSAPNGAAGREGQSLDELVNGFVAYIEAAHAELSAAPGEDTGAAPVGPDGTAHMTEPPHALGTDEAGDAQR